ncbi:hypothetical protein [Halostella litorea]|uniref:hypothetical protein n=1 Tax=Halostella litorea TaxID=2528831 RepID=UPI00192A371C|nr:hypothetical protein [Halostella litorea]
MVDVPTAKRALAALARGERAGDREVVRRASAATEDVAHAAAFVETVGLDRLREAVRDASDRRMRRRGARALAEFERFRRAAHGDGDGRPRDGSDRARGTDIRPDRQGRDT